MKHSSGSLYLQISAILLALSFGAVAHAESPREELVHAYRLLAHADADYAGHRGNAMKEITLAGVSLGLRLEGDAPQGERQWLSDQKLREARRLLKEAREKLEVADRDRAATRVDRAIQELDLALNEAPRIAPPPIPPPPVAPPVVVVASPREELIHAYRLLAHADADYGGHRGNAMKHLTLAGASLGLRLQGDAPEGERQWQSDQKLREARRLLKDARERLEVADRDRAADRVDRAIQELDVALKVN